jgi:hypothetical protein
MSASEEVSEAIKGQRSTLSGHGSSGYRWILPVALGDDEHLVVRQRPLELAGDFLRRLHPGGHFVGLLVME